MVVGTPVRKVVTLGHPVLRAQARLLAPEDILAPEVQRLIAEMAASMDEYEGVGIAAPQVAEGLSLFLMGLPAGGSRHPDGIEPTVVFNPTVRFLGTEKLLDYEGCLSVPGLRGEVPRFAALELSGLDRQGRAFTKEFTGFPARVVQHEVDHLLGKVYLDRMADLSTLAYVDQARAAARLQKTPAPGR
ncbi:MAG: peptide deformylase [Elusimicrobiota bacterium]